MKNEDPSISSLKETRIRLTDTHRLKVKGWKEIFHANRKEKKSKVAILLSDKIDLKIKNIKRVKEGNYIMINGSSKKRIKQL